MRSNKEEFLKLLSTLEVQKQSCCLLLRSNQDDINFIKNHKNGAFFIDIAKIQQDHLYDHLIVLIQNESVASQWIIIEQAELLSVEQQAIISHLLARVESRFYLVFTTTSKQNDLGILERCCLTWHIDTIIPSTKENMSLRSLILPYFKTLPCKDDKTLLMQLPLLIQALALESADITSDDLRKNFNILMGNLLQSLHSPIQGQLLARLIKWSCYRYLKAKKVASCS
ncbi:hypothetical protein EBR43_01650 [bacterium]|nr:hypothetical protein [bacterium]